MTGVVDTTAGELDAARAALVRFGRRMVQDHLVVGSAGNLSIRVRELIVITPSGVAYDEIGEADVCVLNADGEKLSGRGRPSSEYPMHKLIYESFQAGAVVHTHSTAAVAVSITNAELPAVHYSILRLGGPTVRVAGYQTFGSDDLARTASEALRDRRAALLQNHGVIAYAADLAEAYQRAELVEWLCDVYVRACGLGTPRVLDDAELASVAMAARRRHYKGAEQ